MYGYFLEHANFQPADPLTTPEHIAPVWYFTPFYAILRAVPDKLGGVIAMGLAIVVLFFLPWIDRGKVRSIRYRSTAFKVNLGLFVIAFLALGYLGVQPATPAYTWAARFFSLIYFGYFVALWLISRNETTKPVPERVTT
jgi:ubiquinol-cytochrome c reductase cytochrome b subunit